MKYQIGDLVELYDGYMLVVDLLDDDQPDTEDNRGLFEYINAPGKGSRPESIHSARMYNEDRIRKVHGNIYIDGWDILDATTQTNPQ